MLEGSGGMVYQAEDRPKVRRQQAEAAIQLAPLNSIARKNLSRLATLGEEAAPRQATQKLSPQMFIEEMGKTGVTTLLKPNMEIAARMTAGDQVDLRRDNGSLVVKTTADEVLGAVEA